MDDQRNLDEAVQLIRASIPEVTTLHFITSEHHNGYGFVLSGIDAPNEMDLRQYPALVDEVDDLLADIEWRGVLHENKQGYARLDCSERFDDPQED